MAGLEEVTGLRAAPDTLGASLAARIAGASTRALTGRYGRIVGYDRSHPGDIVTGPVPAVVPVSAVIGQSAVAPDGIYMTPAQFGDGGLNEPQLAPLAALQYARLQAPPQ